VATAFVGIRKLNPLNRSSLTVWTLNIKHTKHQYYIKLKELIILSMGLMRDDFDPDNPRTELIL
jgi:hypothetical protein